jgi:hypothetical protein
VLTGCTLNEMQNLPQEWMAQQAFGIKTNFFVETWWPKRSNFVVILDVLVTKQYYFLKTN